MDTYLYTDTEFQLSRERNRKYFGAVRIKLRQIIPHPSISTGLDSHNVDRLCEIFRKDRCRRSDVQNHVTAVVADRHLREALDREELTREILMTNNNRGEYPLLDFGTNHVLCLHGQHRLKAAEEVLHSNDQWWIVDVYSDDISPELQATLVDGYSNERTPSDGEVYCKVRQYQYESNARLEGRWMARLSSNKAKRLRQLSSHPTVRAGFDSLLAIPALLLHGMMLGSLPRALAADIPEEMVTGLQNLKEYWSSIFKGDRGKMLRLDVHTVEKTQLLAPGLSAKETTTIQGLVLSGQVFSNFSKSERRSIWKRLKRKKTIIPSLYTFFQNMWYLEACANGLKRLVSLDKYAATVKNGLFATFGSSKGGCLIQTSENRFRQCSTSSDNSRELAYRQLWLYAMRHYLKLGKEPEGDNLIAKQSCEEADQRCVHDMALLAHKLGFRSPKIEDLINQSPDHQLARATLLKAREPDRFRYENSSFDHLVRRIVDCFQEAVSVDAEPAPEFKEEETLVRRCGFPRRKALQFDRPLLFLDNIHGAMGDIGKVSTFFVRQCVYFFFFGTPSKTIPCAPAEAEDIQLGSGQTAHDPPRSPLFVPQVSYSEPRTSNKFKNKGRSRDRPGKKSRKQMRRERHRQWERGEHRPRECYSRDVGMGSHSQTQQSEDIPTSMETESDVVQTAASSDYSAPVCPERLAFGSNTSDEEMEDSDGDWSSEGAETDNDATVLERDLEAEIDRLQRDTSVRKEMDAAKEVPRLSYDQQSPGGPQQRITLNDTVMNDVQIVRTEQSADNSTDERVSPAESSAVNPARTDRPLTRFDFGEAESVQQGGPDDLHQQPLEMVVLRSGTADRESIYVRSVSPAKDIPAQNNAPINRGSEPAVGNTGEKRNPRPVTQIFVEMAEQRSDERITLDLEQTPIQAAWNTKAAPMPPVISSRETLEGLSDGELSEERDEAGMLSPPDPAAREIAAAKLDGRSPDLPPEAVSSHMPDGVEALSEIPRQQSPIPGPSQLNDRSERARRVVTQIDVAAWLTGRNAPEREGAVRPHPSPELSAVAPSDEDAIGPQRTGSKPPEEPRSSTPTGRGQKKLTPRIVASAPRVGRTHRAPQKFFGTPVKIAFKARGENGEWKKVYELDVDPSDPTAVERLARKDARNRQATFYDKDMRIVTPAQCYEAAVEHGTNVIFMDFEGDLKMDEETLASIAREVEESRPHQEAKRRK